MSHRTEQRPGSQQRPGTTGSSLCVPSPMKRKFFSAVFASTQYARAKTTLFEFCAVQDWSAREGASAQAFLASIEEAFKVNTNETLGAAWSIVGTRLEQAEMTFEKLRDTQRRLRHSLRAYLRELTNLKMSLRKKTNDNSELDLYVADFNEDVEFFDALQFFEEEEKELIREIVLDKVKTAVACALNGGRASTFSRRKSHHTGADGDDDMSRSQEKVTSLEAEMSKLMVKLEETQDEFTRERQKSAELLIEMESRVAEKEKHLADLAVERDRLTAANCDLKAKVEVEKRKSVLLLDENRAMEMEVDRRKAELREAENKNAIQEMELADVKGRLGQAESATQVFETEKRKLEEEKHKLEGLAASAKDIEEKLNARISVLDEETQHLRRQNEALQTEMTKEKKDKELAEMKRKEADALLESSRSALALSHKQASEMESANAKLHKKVLELELRLADMQEKIQKLRAGGADAGVGEELDALLEKNGISPSPSPRTVFERLHSDAIARIARLEQFRLEILRAQREALCKVLAACRRTVDKDQFAPQPSLETASGIRKCNSEWFPPIGSYPNYEATKSEQVIDTLKMFTSKSRRPQDLPDTFPILDRAGKLQPIDRKVSALKRACAGTLIGYGVT